MITPTTETSLYDIPDGTVLEEQVRKPHAGRIELIKVAPDGRYWVEKHWDLFVDDLVARNAKGENLKPVPNGITVHTRAAWEAMKAARNE